MSKKMWDEYPSFEVSKELKKNVLDESQKVMKPDLKSLSFKYAFLFFSSLLLSLALCPQRGVGLLEDWGPTHLFHHLLHQSEVLCGLYCGGVFFISTHLLSFFLLSHFERLIVVRRISYLPISLTALFFGFSMTSFFSTLELSPSYFISWFAVVTLGGLSLNFYYSMSYK